MTEVDFLYPAFWQGFKETTTLMVAPEMTCSTADQGTIG